MNSKKSSDALKTVSFSAFVIGLATAVLWYGASLNTTVASSAEHSVPAATFAGTGTGAVPDSASGTCGTPGNPLNVTFNASGLSGSPSSVGVSMTFGSPNHTWAGDIVAVLIAPNGASHNVFGRVGATTATGAGDSSDLGGLYSFADGNTSPPSGGFWQAAAAEASGSAPIAAGAYRTTNSGGAGATNPMPATNMNAAFASVPNANGLWTLRLTDGCAGDTGSVTAAVLDVTGSVVVPGEAPNDVTGDGRSDFINVRADGAPLGEFMGANDLAGKDKVGNMQRRAESLVPQIGIGWWVANGATSAPIARYDLGQDTDFFLTGDYDNDGRMDLTIWTPGAAGVAAFRILQSSNSTVVTRLYGQSGDDPTIGGDWNNDGQDDLAVYRDGTAGSPQSYFFWSDPDTPTTVNYIEWGTDGDIPFALDYDGDNRSDAAVQRNAGGGAARFYIRQSSNGAVVTFLYGLSSDFVVPGDYDGDGRDDICVSRNANFGNGTFKYFWIRESDGGGFPDSPFQWGIPGDFITQGDWDGDGRTDLGVWRSNADPLLNFFYIRRSSDGSLYQMEWGRSGDYPVNNWNVH